MQGSTRQILFVFYVFTKIKVIQSSRKTEEKLLI